MILPLLLCLPAVSQIWVDNYVTTSVYTDADATESKALESVVHTITKVDPVTNDTVVKNTYRTKQTAYKFRGNFERNTDNLWRYNFPGGYCDLKSGKCHYYLTDRMSSVRFLLDDDGGARYVASYYPSGVPYNSSSNRFNADRLHIGNLWLGMSGLGWYDNHARMHDALLCRFITPDAKWYDYPSLSSYSHCAANPLNIIDPSGNDVAVLNKEPGVITGHLAMLIQNENGKWSYFSINGKGNSSRGVKGKNRCGYK